MMVKQGKNNRQAQSILYLTLLISTLIFTTGCFSKNDRHIVNARSQRGNDYNRPFPDPSSTHRPQYTQNDGSYVSDSSIQLAENIENTVEAFLNEAVVGYIQLIEIDFHQDSMTIIIQDEGESYFKITLTFVSESADAIVYEDSEGSVSFEMTQDPNISQVSFENTDGTNGILGYIQTCRVEGSC